MGRRRPKIEGTNASEYIREDLKNKIDALMINRRKILAPFPVEPRTLYRQFWTDAEWDALQVLPATMFRKRQAFTIDLPEGAHMRVESSSEDRETISVDMGEEKPFDSHHIDLDKIDPESRALIADWVPLWGRYESERIALIHRVNKVGNMISTYGQAFRLWPDLQGFFPEYGREKINKAKVASRLPDPVYEWEYYDDPEEGRIQKITGLAPDWTPQVFAVFTDMIAECLMLPEMEDMREVASGVGS